MHSSTVLPLLLCTLALVDGLSEPLEEYESSLFRMVETGRHEDVERVLLKYGRHLVHEPVQIAPNYTSTLLHLSIIHAEPLVMDVLLEHGADANAVDEWHLTPLHLAIVWRVEVRSLLRHGARVDIPDSKGATALHFATSFDFQLEELLKETPPELLPRLVNLPDKYGIAPIHVVKRARSAYLLVRYGANPRQLSFSKRSPLHFACMYDPASRKERITARRVVVALLVNGVGVDVQAVDCHGFTALDYVEHVWLPSKEQRDTDMIRLLQADVADLRRGIVPPPVSWDLGIEISPGLSLRMIASEEARAAGEGIVVCPISLVTPRVPVLASDGQTV
jgi:ankyrin repeat protein